MRIRSPNYPSVPLEEAIDLIRKIYSASRTNPIDREAAVKDLGYSGITGRSGKILSTLIQYALLEKTGKGGVRVSQIAVDIIHPDPTQPVSHKTALQKAAFAPQLFGELRDRFHDGVPSGNAIRSYLTRQNFADIAINPAMNAYLETCRFLQQEGAYDSYRLTDEMEDDSLQETYGASSNLPAIVPSSTQQEPPPSRFDRVQTMSDERVIFSEETGPEQSLRLIAKGDLDANALEALEDFIKRQKKRLGMTA